MLYDVLFGQRLHNIVGLEHAHKIHLLGARDLGIMQQFSRNSREIYVHCSPLVVDHFQLMPL